MTPYTTAVNYCDKARQVDGACKVVGYDGAEHGFSNAPNFKYFDDVDNPEKEPPNDYYQQTLFEVDRFLSGLGYIGNSER